MAITRRQFLQRGAVTAGSLLGSALWTNPFVRRAFAAPLLDRYVVVLFLDGGNDGLNTVVPVDNGGATLRDAYNAARGSSNNGLNITPAQLGATLLGPDPGSGALIALHPALTGLKRLYDLSKVAVVQGCGYPEYSMSHSQSRAIWESGNPLGESVAGGWAGRYLGLEYGPIDIPGMTVADAVAPELRTALTSVLAVRQVSDFGFPYDLAYPADDAFRRDAFEALFASASTDGQSTLVYVGDSGTATLIASESYPPLHDLYTGARGAFDQRYGDLSSSTARKLREVAKVIYGVEQGVPNVSARLFQLANGGYDTHAGQGGAQPDGQHYGLHKEVGDAIDVFYDDLADMGVASKVTILVWSEFSRRIQQNGNGTDHGSQGPMFVIGGSVAGGLYGKHPNINPSAWDTNGNTPYRQGAASTPFRSTDFRDVYGTVLKHWMSLTPAQITGNILPLDAGDPTVYWTTPNFDMGFLV